MTGKFSVNLLANRSISISLEEGLLAQLDAQGSNRSALVSEALVQWLARRRIDALNGAYAHLASLESGDLAEAGDASVAMGLSAVATEADGSTGPALPLAPQPQLRRQQSPAGGGDLADQICGRSVADDEPE